MAVLVNICMSKIMCTSIKVCVRSYATYANCQTLRALTIEESHIFNNLIDYHHVHELY